MKTTLLNAIKLWSHLKWTGKLSLVFLITLIIFSIVGPLFVPHSHIIPSGNSLQPPSLNHLLGTDDLGIDLLAQIIHGARISLAIGLCSAICATLIGFILASIASYFGGVGDVLIMRIADVFLALPQLPLLILFSSFFAPSLRNMVIVLSILSWARPCRLMRAKILSLSTEGYIRAAKAYGADFFYLMKEHLLADLFPIFALSIIKLSSRAILAESGLAFIGLGDPTSKSWGLILNHSLNFRGIYFTEFWKWWVVSPLLAMILLLLSLSSLARNLELVFDQELGEIYAQRE